MQDIQTNGSIEGVYSVVYSTITITNNGVPYNYSVPVRVKVNAIY